MTKSERLPLNEEMSFEQALKRLEEIVNSLESGRDVSLDEMIAAYSEGLQLSKLCQQKLNEAELQIKEISGEGPSAAVQSEEEKETE